MQLQHHSCGMPCVGQGLTLQAQVFDDHGHTSVGKVMVGSWEMTMAFVRTN
jgi:hypothetical protein